MTVQLMASECSQFWLTCGSPTTEGMVNPLIAACQRGYIPTEVRVLTNEGVQQDVDKALNIAETVIRSYGGKAGFDTWHLDRETDFKDIVAYYRESIAEARSRDATVAIDFTPGRKFMSAIAFQAGMQFKADHVFYFYRNGRAYQGDYLPEIPRTAYELIDFTEEI